MRSLVTFLLVIFTFDPALAQTGVGLGIYPTGSETGLSLRFSKEKKLTGEVRVAKANFMNEKAGTSSFMSEASLIWRVVFLERVRFHTGLGLKTEWRVNDQPRHGVVIPLGVEAFPFPFQNAGLFFEAAPFYIRDGENNFNAGIRTAGGIVFYFLRKQATHDQEL